MKAARLKDVDRSFYIHQQAYANFRVKATRRAGKNKTKPVFSRFDKFYDYKAAVAKVLGKKSRFDGLKKQLKRMKEGTHVGGQT